MIALQAETPESLARLASIDVADARRVVAAVHRDESIAAPVKGVRRVGKRDMVHNSYQPKMSVDAETYEVRADGELLVCEPAKVLPMAQRYFLF